MIHYLKTEARYYSDVCTGQKTFEVRYNDRNYEVQDLLCFIEVEKPQGEHQQAEWVQTGQYAFFEITYIMNDQRWLKENYVVMSIQPVDIQKINLLQIILQIIPNGCSYEPQIAGHGTITWEKLPNEK